MIRQLHLIIFVATFIQGVTATVAASRSVAAETNAAPSNIVVIYADDLGNTLVVFSSDNGPWLTMGNQGGSSGLLRVGKGSTWEGGMRVPGIAWMPGKIKPGVTTQMASVLDLYPTAISLACAPFPKNVELDGVDLSPLLFERKPLAERPFFYYRGTEIFACRIGEWKAHFRTQIGYGQPKPDTHVPPILFNLGVDPSEKRNVAEQNPEVLAKIEAAVREHQNGVVSVPQQLK